MELGHTYTKFTPSSFYLCYC